MTGDPLADFYERVRLPNESPTIYTVELEATLRSVEERMETGPLHNRNSMLTQQFMRGVRDEKVTQRLAPMRPRDMTFHELQVELRELQRESKMAAALKSTTKVQYQRPYQQQQQPPKPPQQLPQPALPNNQSNIKNQEPDSIMLQYP